MQAALLILGPSERRDVDAVLRRPAEQFPERLVGMEETSTGVGERQCCARSLEGETKEQVVVDGHAHIVVAARP